ncbi:hypothetical protein, partial [Escherichia coli]|uniref:hypothetical protein n=1 Tax=Escherichia coli TaxID=562 RepID=UPI0013D669F8
HYDAAERYLKALTDSLGPAAATQEMSYLILAYYQRNRFDRISASTAPASSDRPLMRLIRAFTERPYQLDWTGLARVSTVPL